MDTTRFYHGEAQAIYSVFKITDLTRVTAKLVPWAANSVHLSPCIACPPSVT